MAALHHLQPVRHVCGRGSPYPKRPCGYSDVRTNNTLCRGIEVKQDRRYSPRANPLVRLPGAFRSQWLADRKGMY